MNGMEKIKMKKWIWQSSNIFKGTNRNLVQVDLVHLARFFRVSFMRFHFPFRVCSSSNQRGQRYFGKSTRYSKPFTLACHAWCFEYELVQAERPNLGPPRVPLIIQVRSILRGIIICR